MAHRLSPVMSHAVPGYDAMPFAFEEAPLRPFRSQDVGDRRHCTRPTWASSRFSAKTKIAIKSITSVISKPNCRIPVAKPVSGTWRSIASAMWAN